MRVERGERALGVMVFLLLSMAFVAAPSAAQVRGDDAERASKNGLAEGQIGDVEVAVTYGRPRVKGRKIFGGLVPYGRIWRAGADEATTITFSSDVTIGGETVPGGTYSLFYLPEQNGWTAVLNGQLGQWGAYDYDPKKDLLRAPATVAEQDETVEELTYSVEADGVVLEWDDHRVLLDVATADS
ncbi:MAG: DUF2911 domain-containing protein [Acidobacteriota bacterium]